MTPLACIEPGGLPVFWGRAVSGRRESGGTALRSSLRSPVNFAVLGLVIERPSYGYELLKRLQSRYGELLEVRSPSHVYAALDRLQGEGLVEGLAVPVAPADAPARQPKVNYRATAAGGFAYRQWIAERLHDDDERVELLGRLIAVGIRDLDGLNDLLDRYDAQCVAASQRIPLAQRLPAGSGKESPAEVVRRLVTEERRFVLEGQLRWIDYAREELRACARSRSDAIE